jgi:hypothetical protein
MEHSGETAEPHVPDRAPAKTLMVGVQADAMLSVDGRPFPLEPSRLGGVEARRHLGEHAPEVEAELR